MADMTAYLTTQFNGMIAKMAKDLGDTGDRLGTMQQIIRALKNPDMVVDGGSLTLDRIQIMENGDFRILPMPPAPPITEVCAQEPKSNGKKDAKELTNAS
jgi:hypothetical protein